MQALRERVVQEAYRWLNTPYHHQQHCFGAGVDCVWLLIECYKTVGVVPEDFDPGYYSTDWYLHKDIELYMGGVLKFAKQLPEGSKPQIADVALYKVGRCVSHGAIVVGEDLVIHANRRARKVELTDMSGILAKHFHSIWTPFP